MLPLILLVISTVFGYAGATDSCVDEQTVLIGCVLDRDISGALREGNLTVLCSHVLDLQACVNVARGACPTMELLQYESFVQSIDMLEQVYKDYCQDTVDEQQKDETNSCPQGALLAMLECSKLMDGISPGDLEAMCDRRGEEYLQCMEAVVEDCPNQEELVHYNLPDAIQTTRQLLAESCPSSDRVCEPKTEEAMQHCSSHLTNGLDANVYCGSLELYMRCMEEFMTSCPNQEMLQQLQDQFHHHCAVGKTAPGLCPENINFSMAQCFQYQQDINMDDMEDMCRKSNKFMECVENLMTACGDKIQIENLNPTSLEQAKQHLSIMCSSVV